MDQGRKCFKCGKTNKNNDDLHLFRFPNPGIYNISRCEAWAQFCMPDAQWWSVAFQKKLHSEHRMLCDKHFKTTDFLDAGRKKLKRLAVPSVDQLIRHDHDAPPNVRITLKDITNAPTSAVSKDVSDSQLPPQLVESSVVLDHGSYSSKRPNTSKLSPQVKSSGGHGSCAPNLPSTSKSSPQVENMDVTDSQLPSQLIESSVVLDHGFYSSKLPTTPKLSSQMKMSGGHGSCAPNLPSTSKQSPQVENMDVSDSQLPPQLVESSVVLDHGSYSSKRPNTSKLSPQVKRSGGHGSCAPNLPSTSKPSPQVGNIRTRTERAIIRTDKERVLYNKLRNQLKKVARLQKTVKKLKGESFLNAITNNKAVNDICNNRLTSSFAVLLQAQLRNTRKKPRGRRWTEDEKIIALRLYRRSPAGYRLLRRLFALPTQTTLKGLLKRLPMDVGPNQKVFDVLKINFELAEPQDRECVLMFDEMSLRKHHSYNIAADRIDGYQDHGQSQGRTNEVATHALVFMISAIRKKMKQPVAYYLSGNHVTADRLVVLIKEVLGYCFRAGIRVATLICDQDGVNRRALTSLGVTTEKPYFNTENQEVVAMFDTPHLLKSFRNLFLKYNISCPCQIGDLLGQGVASWSHIKEFYEKDNENPNFVYAPALTKAHMEPNQKQKMKVRLAAQVLSHSVAAGLYSLAGTGELPQAATVTASVVSKMDKLFDAVNGDCPDLRRGKPFLTNFSERTKHTELFNEMKDFFKKIQFIGSHCRPPSLDGWIQSMNGIQRVWKNLKELHPDIGSLATRRLQQDPIENLFGCIRANCGANSNPTVEQFIGGLKTAILSNLSTVGLSNKNCEDDDAQIMNNLKSLLQKTDDPLHEIPPHMVPNLGDNGIFGEVDCCEATIDELDPTSSEIQACAYVCGFIAKKMGRGNVCAICKSLFSTESPNPTHMHTQMREYRDAKSLMYSSNQLITCVESCATHINNFLKEKAHTDNLLRTLKNELNNSPTFKFLESCKEHYCLNKQNLIVNIFFICVKRFITLKNRSYAEEASLVALKKKVNILKHV